MPDLSVLEDVFKQITSLGPEMLLVLVIIVIGYGVRCIDRISNRLIPLFSITIGAVAYPFMASPGIAPTTFKNPTIRLIAIGILIGFIAWAVHRIFLQRLEEKYFPKGLKLGDTEIIRKQNENPPTPPAPPPGGV